jgi:hypothetical protein
MKALVDRDYSLYIIAEDRLDDAGDDSLGGPRSTEIITSTRSLDDARDDGLGGAAHYRHYTLHTIIEDRLVDAQDDGLRGPAQYGDYSV